jgi:hypothetical protein
MVLNRAHIQFFIEELQQLEELEVALMVTMMVPCQFLFYPGTG